jgi:hypothetical protein
MKKMVKRKKEEKMMKILPVDGALADSVMVIGC